MKKLSNLLKKNLNKGITVKELSNFAEITAKNGIKKELQEIYDIMARYNMIDYNDISFLIDNNKKIKIIKKEIYIPKELQEIQEKYSMDSADMKKLANKIITQEKLFGNLNFLPMFMSEQERKAVMVTPKRIDDICLDLDTERGQNKAYNKYKGVVIKSVNRAVKNSNMSFDELLGAANEGFAYALKSYKKDYFVKGENMGTSSEEQKNIESHKYTSFGQYSGYMCLYYIQMYAKNNNAGFKITDGMRKQFGIERNDDMIFKMDSLSMTVGSNSDGDEDRTLGDVIGDDESYSMIAGEDETTTWEKVFGELEKALTDDQISIFYSLYGFKGYDKMTIKEIAADFGRSINWTHLQIKKIHKLMKEMPEIAEYLSTLRDYYTENKLFSFFKNKKTNKKEISESLIEDEIFVDLVQKTKQ